MERNRPRFTTENRRSPISSLIRSLSPAHNVILQAIDGRATPTIPAAAKILDRAKIKHCQIVLPEDVVVAKEFKADAKAEIKAANAVADDDLILDIGPKTAATLATQLKAAGTIVWNGPVGVFEFDAFAKGTETVARAIAASSAFSIAGGGDTLAAIEKYGVEATRITAQGFGESRPVAANETADGREQNRRVVISIMP